MKASGKPISILAVNVLLFLLLCVLVEGVFRIAGIPYKVKYIPNENSFARFDPELGWSYVPNKSAIHTSGSAEIPVHFDRNGIRVAEADFQLDHSRPSILFIGGSFTMGHGLLYDESFVGKFDALQKARYQVVNLGVQGYGSDQALIALRRYLPKFKARYVVYTFIRDHILRNGNYDRRMLVPTARFLGTKPQFALSGSKSIYLTKKPVLYEDYRYSYLVDFIRMRMGSLLGLFPPFPEELTREIINEMKKYSNEHGAQFVVLNWRWTSRDYDRLFQDADIDTIDTMEAAPAGWEKMVLFGGIHPNAEASEYAAGLLVKHLREKGLLN